jgi:AcrR family transcriptional regulator
MAKSAARAKAKNAADSRAARHRAAATARSDQSGGRAKRSAERRSAILDAAFEEFSTRGFAATRLDDVARRADVAKGTIYLHFADKETLFQELIRAQLSPVIGALEHAAHAEVPLHAIADRFVEVFVREVYETRRKDVIRLIITEGQRFPKLAEFYYREVIARGLEALRGAMRRAVERGELSHQALVQFPQLLIAPGLVGIIWNGLFEQFEPLDVRAMMHAQFDIVFANRSAA